MMRLEHGSEGLLYLLRPLPTVLPQKTRILHAVMLLSARPDDLLRPARHYSRLDAVQRCSTRLHDNIILEILAAILCISGTRA